MGFHGETLSHAFEKTFLHVGQRALDAETVLRAVAEFYRQEPVEIRPLFEKGFPRRKGVFNGVHAFRVSWAGIVLHDERRQRYGRLLERNFAFREEILGIIPAPQIRERVAVGFDGGIEGIFPFRFSCRRVLKGHDPSVWGIIGSLEREGSRSSRGSFRNGDGFCEHRFQLRYRGDFCFYGFFVLDGSGPFGFRYSETEFVQEIGRKHFRMDDGVQYRLGFPRFGRRAVRKGTVVLRKRKRLLYVVEPVGDLSRYPVFQYPVRNVGEFRKSRVRVRSPPLRFEALRNFSRPNLEQKEFVDEFLPTFPFGRRKGSFIGNPFERLSYAFESVGNGFRIHARKVTWD